MKAIIADATEKFYGTDTKYRFQKSAREAISDAVEQFGVRMFQDSRRVTLFAKRKTLFPKDLKLMIEIRGDLSLDFRPPNKPPKPP